MRKNRKKRTRGLIELGQPVVITTRRDPIIIQLTLHQDGGAMYAQVKQWQPLSVNVVVDPEARGFAEAVRVLVMQYMKPERVTTVGL